jgi:hypothetical protein
MQYVQIAETLGQFEFWLRKQRDSWPEHSPEYTAFDAALDQLRHAWVTGTGFAAGYDDHVAAARALMARKAGRDLRPCGWTVVTEPSPGEIYDWADPSTGEVGQCWLTPHGLWKQPPLGPTPVVLRRVA